MDGAKKRMGERHVETDGFVDLGIGEQLNISDFDDTEDEIERGHTDYKSNLN